MKIMDVQLQNLFWFTSVETRWRSNSLEFKTCVYMNWGQCDSVVSERAGLHGQQFDISDKPQLMLKLKKKTQKNRYTTMIMPSSHPK